MRIRWQLVLRVVLALFAVAFAVVVYLGIRQRQPSGASSGPAPRTDPDALVESTKGQSIIARGTQQDFKVDYERMLTYADGSLRFEGVKVFIPQRQGRDFTISGRHATVKNNQNDVAMDGDVRLATSDGLTAAAGSATYQNADGMLHVPGPVTFEKQRLKGSGVGATYDRNRDVLWLLQDAVITVAADPATGSGQVEIRSGAAGFARRDRYLRFENGVHMLRDGTTIASDNAVAYLAPDEDRLQMLELRGNSSVKTPPAQPGALESMSARDINMTYAPDGRTLQQTTLAGNSSTQMAGPPGQQGRRLSAEWIEFVLAPDGTTLTSLVARERVVLDIPGDGAAVPARRVRSTALEGSGEEGKGLTVVRFLENVEFTEQRPQGKAGSAIDRTARSRTLDAVMQPGFGGIDRATFAGGVTFQSGTTSAQAPDATYDLAKGVLVLVAQPASPPARVDDEQVTVDARKIDLTLETNAMVADGDVRSLLKSEPAGKDSASPHKRPGMLRGDAPVNVTARHLVYDGSAGTAVYTGDARLWQGETAVQGATVSLDDRQGNLAAKGNVRSAWRLADKDPKSGKVEEKTTISTADDLLYEDAQRRATYTGNARMNGPQGDLRAAKIELYFDESGDSLDRLDATTSVVLQSDKRLSTGVHLTYFAGDQRYVMTGNPVRVLEQMPAECRETLGKTLTFFRSTDTILVDGNEESRTQTTSGGKCPGPPPGH